ncbi:hypothetical protein [Micromonospora cathayae]|uniref:Uncharacterized protein n=1 Tax=Micromonospora cathayae TaxID=3028804 RepID=A0ABY7ZRG2_9ACTN|nr:hypothetical protein [Micromonospora sp. HUAS 3]WDZ84792.1 hypothetical protein PVK37_30980 [Micromonospora sp. HUAS 3]
MTTSRTGPGPVPVRRPRPTPRPAAGPVPELDYYLVCPRQPDAGWNGYGGPVEGIVVEEFRFDADHTVRRIDSAAWTPGEVGWWTAPDLSRRLRTDPALRGRVVGAARPDVAAVYHRLGGGTLPDEDTLRGRLAEGEPRRVAPPLVLNPTPVAPGGQATRTYRVLFAHELTPDGLARLADEWRMVRPAATRSTGVLGTAHRRVGADTFRWELRRIGSVGAYCLDVTVDLATGRDGTVRPVLRELTTSLRRQGLVPVTVERFC